MNDLFIKTMMKLQENRKVEKKSKKLLREAFNGNEEINSIEDVDGFEADVVTVIDPELTTDEFIERQDELNKLIDQTPEGEQVVSTEYVDQHIYTCPLCLTNFYSETEMAPEAKCPVCYEIPTEFIYLGKVEQNINNDDEKLLDNAEEEVNSTEPTEGEGDLDTFNDIESEPIENEEPTEDEEETLTASKKVSTKGNTLKEDKVEESVENLGGYAALLKFARYHADELQDTDDLWNLTDRIGGMTLEDIINEAPEDFTEEDAQKLSDYIGTLPDEDRYKIWDEIHGSNLGESKSLKENLQVGGSLYFKVKNDIVPTQIINIYVDDFNDKTYIQYSDNEGRRSGTMPSEEILKGLEEGTITSENPAPAPVEQAPVETPVEAPVEDSNNEEIPMQESYNVAGIDLVKEEFEQLDKINTMLERKESISNIKLYENVSKVLKKFEII